MKRDEIIRRLYALRDEKYLKMQQTSIPTLPKERFIGVRTPALRALAREIAGQADTEDFLRLLPHEYFEENQLHAFVISMDRDFDRCAARVEAFLPYVDNWATCDQMSPRAFAKHREDLLPRIRVWLRSAHPYAVRFGIGMLMAHFLDDAYDDAYPRMVAEVQSEDYYVRMMQAWYFATALARQYDAALPYLAEKRLDQWTHNKAIQKAAESYRVPQEHKEYLKTLWLK